MPPHTGPVRPLIGRSVRGPPKRAAGRRGHALCGNDRIDKAEHFSYHAAILFPRCLLRGLPAVRPGRDSALFWLRKVP